MSERAVFVTGKVVIKAVYGRLYSTKLPCL